MFRRWCWILVLGGLGGATASAATPQELIATIREVGSTGQGHTAAMAALKELSRGDAAVLPVLLGSFEGASPLAANWLLGAFESIADRALAGQKLPAKEFEAFAVDVKQHPGARRLAYEWLLKVDATAADRLIPGMLQDPNAEFRRDAVARLISAAEAELKAEKKETAQATYQLALKGAVDDDQVQAIVKPLRELGVEVNLQKHFGFLTSWRLIGPFDNTDKAGFDVAYPPEKELLFDTKYAGKSEEIGWIEHTTEQEYGIVDLRKALAHHKGAITYAATTFISAADQQVELRLGTPNAWKVWVNGALLFARDEYHRGEQLDQYKVPAKLKEGPNVILLKVCQNEQTEEWAQEWQFQIRVCDPAGAAILSATPATTRVDPATNLQLVSTPAKGR